MGFFRKVEDEIKRVGRKIDDEILQPVKNTVETIVEDPRKLAGVALAIAFPGAGAALGAQLGLTGVAAKVVGQTLINTAINGGDLKSAAVSAAIPLVGKEVANSLSSTLAKSGVEGTLNSVITNAATQGATAAVLGKDPTSAFLFGGVNVGLNAMMPEIPGYNELPEYAKKTLNSAVVAKLTGGNSSGAINSALVNEALSWAKSEVNNLLVNSALGISHDPSMLEEGAYRYNQVFDPKTAGMVDLSEPSIEGYEFTTDFTPGASLELFPGLQGPGIKAPPVETEVFRPDGSVNYDFFDFGGYSGEPQLEMPRAPNMPSMGGGQGFVVPVDGGVMTESGFIPNGYTSDLGDPSSFINKPPPGGDVSDAVQRALDASARATATDLKKASQTKPPASSPVDLTGLLGLLGGQQGPVPLVVPENAADIELMEEIFGTSLSAPSTGKKTELAAELARLLRS